MQNKGTCSGYGDKSNERYATPVFLLPGYEQFTGGYIDRIPIDNSKGEDRERNVGWIYISEILVQELPVFHAGPSLFRGIPAFFMPGDIPDRFDCTNYSTHIIIEW